MRQPSPTPKRRVNYTWVTPIQLNSNRRPRAMSRRDRSYTRAEHKNNRHLKVSPLLPLARDAWSKVIRLRQDTKEYIPPPLLLPPHFPHLVDADDTNGCLSEHPLEEKFLLPARCSLRVIMCNKLSARAGRVSTRNPPLALPVTDLLYPRFCRVSFEAREACFPRGRGRRARVCESCF